jgi:cytochrome d ubiquinol oxidase subunit II
MVILKNGINLSLTTMAGAPSITALGWALLIGSGLIFPSLFYLIHIFEGRTKETGV